MMIQTYTSLYIQLLTQIQASTIRGGFGLSEGRRASVPMPFQTKSDKHHTIPVTNDPQSVSPQINPPDALASSQNDHHPCQSRHPVSAQSDLCEALHVWNALHEWLHTPCPNTELSNSQICLFYFIQNPLRTPLYSWGNFKIRLFAAVPTKCPVRLGKRSRKKCLLDASPCKWIVCSTFEQQPLQSWD